MPKPRRAKSLTEMCLQLVASHLANFNPDVRSTETTSAISEEEKLNTKSVLVQLDLEKLPQQLIEKVIEALRTSKWLSIIRHQELMTTPSTKVLDFTNAFPSEAECPPDTRNDSESDSESIAQLLKLAATRCPKLTHLLMSSTKAQLSCFLNFIPLFQHLLVLDVSHSGENFDDSCLHLLGIHCHNLRELDVSYCNITDDGIKALVLVPASSGQCKSLQHLSIIGNLGVTDEGAQIALRHLPNLKILNYERLVQALADMEKVSIRPEYALTKLMSAKRKDSQSSQSVPYSYRNGALPMAVSLCPSVTELCLHLHGITDSELRSVRLLKNLRELKLENAGTSRITFNDGLAPLLKDVGSSLKSLELERLKPSLTIHVEELVEYCPNLVRLSIDWCYFRTSTDFNELTGRLIRKTCPVWKHLRELNLSSKIDVWDSTNVMMPAESLILILASSPALKELSIVGWDYLTDDVLRRVFRCHSFSFLEVLKLEFCDIVTREGINLFMNDGNNLKKFESDCALLTVQDLMELEFQAKQQNWDLKVVSLFENYYTDEDF